MLAKALIDDLCGTRVLQTAPIAFRFSPRGYLDVQGQPGQQVFSPCQFLQGHGIVWMLAQVTLEALMRLRQEIGGADEITQAHIDGSLIVEQAGRGQHRADMDESVRELEGPRVRIVGYVDEPSEWLARTRLLVNPMRFGAGLKQKFLDSLAAGLPFVTTTVGAEGFPLGDVRGSLVANDPAGLAALLDRLYTEQDEWERAQRHLLELARTRFDRVSFQWTLLEAMTYVGVAPPRRVAYT